MELQKGDYSQASNRNENHVYLKEGFSLLDER